jgi:hypothetical protein
MSIVNQITGFLRSIQLMFLLFVHAVRVLFTMILYSQFLLSSHDVEMLNQLQNFSNSSTQISKSNIYDF